MWLLPFGVVSALALAASVEFGCSYGDATPNGPDSGSTTTTGGAGTAGAGGASGSRTDAGADITGPGGASPGKDVDVSQDAPPDNGRADRTTPDAATVDRGHADTGDSGGSGPPPAGRGATLPYWEYQAEDGDTNGTLIGPSRAFGDPAAEASQRRAVRLDAAGQYVRITSKAVANSIVVRYAVPDRGEGPESWSTLSVYVNGAMRAKLPVTSRWSWTYGDFGNPSPNDPAQGKPHHFYDEARALIGDLPAGATISVQKDADDAAAYYLVDLIDLEQVAAPLPQPATSVAITDCGATPDDDSDDQAAIQQCIDRARAQGRVLYIPRGIFRSLAKALSVDNLTIRGAGMWHSTISGFNARFDCYGNGCKYHDFAVSGDTVLRDDKSPESAFSGVTGEGTLLENIWAEHSKTGYWVGPNANNLVIRRSRFRNLYADGINLWKGTSNSIVEQCHFRNTGDDAIASWSPSGAAASANNVLRFNTIQVPWMANCFGLYGGTGNRIEDNLCEDVVQYPGILLARQFGSLPFSGMTQIVRNSLIRAGGPAYGEEQGAIKFHAAEAAMGGFLVQDLTIQDATFAGIHLQGGHRIDNLRFQNVAVNAPGTSGIRLNHDANGAAVANGLVVTRGGMDDQSRGVFTWTREAGNAGW
jgi:Pectate lyase superfamily protein